MLTSFDVKRDTNLFVNTSLVKLRYQQLDLFNSDALTQGTCTRCISTTCIYMYMYITPCLCDNTELVSLILLGWELHVSYITVLCVQGIPILSPLLFMASLYSTFEFLHLLVMYFTLLLCIILYGAVL